MGTMNIFFCGEIREVSVVWFEKKCLIWNCGKILHFVILLFILFKFVGKCKVNMTGMFSEICP